MPGAAPRRNHPRPARLWGRIKASRPHRALVSTQHAALRNQGPVADMTGLERRSGNSRTAKAQKGWPGAEAMKKLESACFAPRPCLLSGPRTSSSCFCCSSAAQALSHGATYYAETAAQLGPAGSGGLFQRQGMRWAAPSSDQPRPISPFSRPHRAWFRHGAPRQDQRTHRRARACTAAA